MRSKLLPIALLFAGSLAAQYVPPGGGGGSLPTGSGNCVVASPANGSSATVACRALVVADETAAGATGAVQYSNAGAFAGDSTITIGPTVADAALNGLTVGISTDPDVYNYGTGLSVGLSIAPTDVNYYVAPNFNVAYAYTVPVGMTNKLFQSTYMLSTIKGAGVLDETNNVFSAVYDASTGHNGKTIGFVSQAIGNASVGTTDSLISLQAITYANSGKTIGTQAGVVAWTGMLSGSTTTNAYAYDARLPQEFGGALSGVNAAWHNLNFTGMYGVGHDYAWYSEGGTNHLETGKADAVGIEVEAFTGQTADLFRTLASDGTTVVTSIDKDSNLVIRPQKSTTGARYACIDTTGKLVSQAAACVGT